MTTDFTHLLSISDAIGTFEHACYRSPRPEHGYCVDDVARALVVACAEGQRSAQLFELERTSLRFVIDAQDPVGRTVNRRSVDGLWIGPATTDDCWGRSVWALGVAASSASDRQLRRFALACYDLCCAHTSSSPRALAFATLGAAEVRGLAHESPRWTTPARRFAGWFDAAPVETSWPWPEHRLAYANATVCEASIAAGMILGRLDLVRRGLELLEWLVVRETVDGHLSPTPVGGAGPRDPSGRFDQQPIEVASLARAARRAFESTYDHRWVAVLDLCVGWFDGANDAGLLMWDAATGAGFDGLHACGVNENCGAESTLAALSTMQQHAAVAQMVS